MDEINILVPWRQQITSTFWEQYIETIITKELCDSLSVDGTKLQFKQGQKAINLIFAITSANHSWTKRNPLDLSKRIMLLDRFGQKLKDVNTFQYPIDNIAHSDYFADYIIKKIQIESQWRFDLNPWNTIPMTSTPELIHQFKKIWFQVLPWELKPGTLENPEYIAQRPWELVEYIVALANAQNPSYWNVDKEVLNKVSKHSINLYQTYQIVPYLQDLFWDWLLGNDGDLTDTRDYRKYILSFDVGAERKYEQLKDYIVPGKIVDIGCCTWSLIEKMAQNPLLHESDFYWIEVARILYDECKKRKEQWYFHNDNVFFLQKNVVTNQAFKNNTIDTFTSCALTHEVYSYQSQQALEDMITLIEKQLKPNWRWINIDVIWPENGTQEVMALLSQDDGYWNIQEPSLQVKEKNYTIYKSHLEEYLNSLSTFDKFIRFAQDFRKEEWDQITYAIVEKNGKKYIKTSYKAICEFMSKKDYTGNWDSEMHEKFCDFSFSDWKDMLEKQWLIIHRDSKAYTNPWIAEHVWKDKAQIFQEDENGTLLWMEVPPTNMIVIAEKQ